MTGVVVLSLFSERELAERLAKTLAATVLHYQLRQFPDGESYFRLADEVKGKQVIVLANLSQPDGKALPLLFIADTLHDLGAKQVGLVSPYLPYMRQDKRFHAGEAVTSRSFAKLVSTAFDWLVAVDPHLHRYRSLDEIYSIPSTVVAAAPAVAAWIKTNVSNPVLIGPDSESEQWVSEVAAFESLPFVILAKTRHGDSEVEVTKPELAGYEHFTPVLIDDIASTGQTLIAAIKNLHESSALMPVCVVVHAVFAGNAYRDLLEAGVSQVASCNTLSHSSNQIDLHDELVKAVQGHLL